MALLEELIERGGFEISLANRSEQELLLLLDFILWKVADYRYQALLLEVLRVIIDLYSGVIG